MVFFLINAALSISLRMMLYLRYVIDTGPVSFLAKVSVKHVFRLLSIHPADRHLCVIQWDKSIYLNTVHAGLDLLLNFSIFSLTYFPGLSSSMESPLFYIISAIYGCRSALRHSQMFDKNLGFFWLLR